MIKNYWNKNIPEWTDPKPPKDPSSYIRRSDYYVLIWGQGYDYRSWQKVTIGRNEYYGKALGAGGKFNRIVFKILPLFLFSVAFAPAVVPLFLATGTYRKLGIWIREVKYSTTIKYINNVANKSLSKSASITVSNPEPLDAALNNDMMLQLLLHAKFTDAEEAKRYLQTLSCVSKAFQPLVNKVSLRLVNEGVISIGDLPGIDNDKDKIFDFLKIKGGALKNLDLSSFELNDQDLITIVKRCPNIEALFIGKPHLSDSGVAEIAKLPKLITLSTSSATNLDGLNHLKALKISHCSSNFDHLINLEKLTIKSSGANCVNFAGLPSLDKLVKLKKLSIESYCLQRLPSLGLLANLEKLTLKCDRAVQLPSLANLSHLKELSLSIYSMQQMPSLDHLVHLKKLSLEGNCLIPYNAFDCITNLEELNVKDMQLQVFPGLDHLTKLKKLSIDCPNLQTLSSLDALVNLKEFSISSLNLRNLPSLDHFNLEKLYVDCQYLTHLSIEHQTNLKELSIIGLGLQQFPSLEACDQLENLYLQGSLQPPSLDTLVNLEELTLNNLQQIPSLDQLHHLKRLRICGHLTNISLNHLKNLKELDITGTGSLPSLDSFPSLEKLALRGVFKNTPSFEKFNLTELFISNSIFEKIDFSNNFRLKKLSLINCPKFKKLPPFSRLINLQEINIQKCAQLKTMPSLENQKKLRILTIQGNGIKEAPNLDHLQHLEDFSFY